MLDALFVKVLELSLSACFVIAAVLLLRLCLRRAPKAFSYALWAVVLVRLLCPFSIPSPVVLVPHYPLADKYMHSEQQSAELPFPNAGTAGVSPYGADDLTEIEGGGVHYEEPAHGGESARRNPGLRIGAFIWAAGMIVLAIYSVISLVRLRQQTACSLRLRENIYLADHIRSPFVCGLLRPRIYLPSELKGEEREYIILHERHHIRRLDPLVKLLAFFALCIHWFNPLVWVMFILMGKDMEMSCDEAVMRHMDGDVRAQYSALLLRFATGRHIIAGAPLAFGEGSPEGRIKHIMNYKKPRFWVIAAALTVCVSAGVCLLSNTSVSAGKRGTENGAGSQTDSEDEGILDTESSHAAGSQQEQGGESGDNMQEIPSWEERNAFVIECLERVTAERLRAVTDGLSLSGGEWMATEEQMQAWDQLEDNYFRIGEEAEGDAVLYGLYGGNAMVLRVKNRVYPIRLDWQNLYQVFPRFYGADYDGDGEIEYAIVRLTETGSFCYVNTLYIVEIDGEHCRLVKFKKEDWTKQLERVTWEFDERTEILRLFADGEETDVTIDLQGCFDGEEFTFHGLIWGDINSFDSNGVRLYLTAEAGINRGTPGSVVYDYDIEMTSELSYRPDGSFQLGKINCCYCPR